MIINHFLLAEQWLSIIQTYDNNIQNKLPHFCHITYYAIKCVKPLKSIKDQDAILAPGAQVTAIMEGILDKLKLSMGQLRLHTRFFFLKCSMI